MAPVAAALVLFAVLAALQSRLGAYAFDDAYIHFRIARHLAEHGHPYYNLGEAVMASSSTGWTIVLAAFFALGGSASSVALLEAAFTTLAVVVYTRLIAAAAGKAAVSWREALASFFIIVPSLMMAGGGLMETPLAILLAGLAMLDFERGRPRAFAWLALACFVRVELGALGVALLVVALMQRRRLGPILAWGAAAALPFVLYDLYFFGTLIPNTIRAKQLGYSLSWQQSLDQVGPSVALGPASFPIAPGAALLVGAMLLFAKPISWTARASFATGCAILAVYIVSHGYVFDWYVPLFTVPILWALAACLLSPALEPRALRALAALALVIPLLPPVLRLPAFVAGAWRNPALSPQFAGGARTRQYIEVAEVLAKRYPGATLLSSEVGGLGWGFPGHIADGFGLVSPAAQKFHPMRVPEERLIGTLGAIPPGYVAEVRPELIVSYDMLAEALQRSGVIRQYTLQSLPLFTEADAAKAAQVGVPRMLWGVPMRLQVWVRNDVAAARGLPFSDKALEPVSKP